MEGRKGPAMGTRTLLGFAAAAALVLLWSWNSKERGFIGGFFAAATALAVIAGCIFVIVRVVLH